MSNGSRKPKKFDAPSLLLSREGRLLRFPLSDLPAELQSVKRHCNALRQVLESECVKRHGSISATRAGLIQSALRFEQMAKQIERMAKDHWQELDPLDKASLLDRLGKYSERRDAAIAKLDLDSNPMKGKRLFEGLDVPTVPGGGSDG